MLLQHVSTHTTVLPKTDQTPNPSQKIKDDLFPVGFFPSTSPNVMFAPKFLLITLALTITLVSARLSRRSSPNRLLTKRDCPFECTGDLQNCESWCSGSGVQKVLVNVCYKGTCYCGFSPT